MLRNTLLNLATDGYLLKLYQTPTTRAIGALLQLRVYHPSERPPLTEEQKRKYPQVEQEITEEGYPVLRLSPRPRNMFNLRPKYVRRRRNIMSYKIREQLMKDDQDWPSVWPTAKTFVPSAVPLPMRQSYEKKVSAVPRGKYANTELLKVVNFLHLTPEAVRRHCSAISKFCTSWPENLDTDEQIRNHLPVTIVTRDYCHSSQDIRDLEARKVQLIVDIDDLKLKGRDRVKLIELAQHRYDPESGILTIATEECPMKMQNQEYAEYLISALYFESQEHQAWEDDRIDAQAVRDINLDDYRKSVEQKLGIN